MLEDPWEGRLPKYTNVGEQFQNEFRYSLYANCWHHSEYESSAMWNQYANRNETVAITIKSDSLISLTDSENYHLNKVKYIDFENDPNFDQFNVNWTGGFIKRKSFEHENEVRILYHDRVEGVPATEFGDKVKYLELKNDLHSIIEKVWINPLAKDWKFECIKNTILQLNQNLEVEKSSLYTIN